jgi:hypothetical protein
LALKRPLRNERRSMTGVPVWRRLLPAATIATIGVLAIAAALAFSPGGSGAAFAADPTAIPGHSDLGNGWLAPGGWQSGGNHQIAITITAISGNSLSLKTTDGWTRTIDATGATITRAGQTIGVGDLKVGDQITFRESRQSDGSYKITTITVVVPTVGGTVTAVSDTSVTVKLGDGSTRTLTLTGTTTYSQGGAAASKTALVVGVRIVAQGSVDSAGNFTASAITIAPATVTGTVASKTASSITVTTSGGTTVTINVTSSTRYVVRGIANATLSNVAVGDRIAAQGTLTSANVLTATVVETAPNDQPGFAGGGRGGIGPGMRGFGRGLFPGGSTPNASPSTGAST